MTYCTCLTLKKAARKVCSSHLTFFLCAIQIYHANKLSLVKSNSPHTHAKHHSGRWRRRWRQTHVQLAHLRQQTRTSTSRNEKTGMDDYNSWMFKNTIVTDLSTQRNIFIMTKTRSLKEKKNWSGSHATSILTQSLVC